MVYKSTNADQFSPDFYTMSEGKKTQAEKKKALKSQAGSIGSGAAAPGANMGKPQTPRANYTDYFGTAEAQKPMPPQYLSRPEFAYNPAIGKQYNLSNPVAERSPMSEAMAKSFQTGKAMAQANLPVSPRTEAEMAKLQAEYEASKTPAQIRTQSVFDSGIDAAKSKIRMDSQETDRIAADNDRTDKTLARMNDGRFRVGGGMSPNSPLAGREGQRILAMDRFEKAEKEKADAIRNAYYEDYEARQAENQTEMGKTAMGASMAEVKSPEEIAQAGRTARMDIGTLVAKYNNQPKSGPNKRPRFDDWVKGLVSTGAINTEDPRDLGMVRALGEERGVDYLDALKSPRDLGGSAEASPEREAPAQSRTSEAMNQAAPKQSAAQNSINVPLRQPSMPMGQVDKGLTPNPGINQPPGVMPDVAYAMRQQGQVLQDPNQRLMTDNILPSPEEAGQVVSVDDIPVVAEFRSPKSSQDGAAQRDESVPMEQAAPPVVNAAEEGGTPLPQIDPPEPAAASWRDITPDPELLREREAQRQEREEAQAAGLLRRQQEAALDGEIMRARAAASARPFQSPDAAEFAIRRGRAIEAARAAELEKIKQEQAPQRAAAEASKTAAEAARTQAENDAAERSRLAISTAANNAISGATSVGDAKAKIADVKAATKNPEDLAMLDQMSKDLDSPNNIYRQRIGDNYNRQRLLQGKDPETMKDYENLFLSQTYNGGAPRIEDFGNLKKVMESEYEASENQILSEIAMSPEFAEYAEKNSKDGIVWTATDFWESGGKDFFNDIVINKLAKDNPVLLGLIKKRGSEGVMDVEKTWNWLGQDDTLSKLSKLREKLGGTPLPVPGTPQSKSFLTGEDASAQKLAELTGNRGGALAQ